MKFLGRNKWFILAVVVAVFLALTSVRVAAAGTDSQLTAVLSAAVSGLTAFFTFLINVLGVIW